MTNIPRMSAPVTHNPYSFPVIGDTAPNNYEEQQQQYISDADLALKYYEEQAACQYHQYQNFAPHAAQSYGYEAYMPAATIAQGSYAYVPPAAQQAGYDGPRTPPMPAAAAERHLAIPLPRSRLAPEVNVVRRIRRSHSIFSESSSSSSSSLSGMMTQEASSEVDATPTEEIEETYHKALLGRCDFVVPPPREKVDGQNQPQYSVTPYRVFVGQIRLEVKAAGLRSLVEFLSGVRPSKIESRGTGCFLMYLNRREDIPLVQSLHRRVLFDKTGVWFARNSDQAAHLATYVAEVVAKAPRGFRLPKDTMVVAEERVSPRSEKSE